MKIRFYNGYILTMEHGLEVEKGELWVEGTKVTYAGAGKEQDVLWDREIDLEGNLLMPGFKNGHTHSAMTFLRSFADDKPLQEWLTEDIFPKEAKMTPEDIYHLSKLAILEYFSSGIVANFDMYYHPAEISRASHEMGMRTVIVGGLNDFAQSIQEIEHNYVTFNDPLKYDGLISYQLGFHAEYTTSKALLEELSELSHKYQAPVYTHLSETEKEVQECIGRYGLTPPKLLSELGLFDYGGGGFHGVHISKEDMKLLKEKKVGIVLNCASNLKLASGIAPIAEYMEEGVVLGIGTDGPASNNSLDMFKEMFLVSGLGKVRSSAEQVGADEVLKMATAGSAKIMGLNDCDHIGEGKLADLIVIDLHQPNMQPINHLTKNIVYSGSKTNIKLTMVNGKIVYEDGVYHVNQDVGQIYREVKKIRDRIIES